MMLIQCLNEQHKFAKVNSQTVFMFIARLGLNFEARLESIRETVAVVAPLTSCLTVCYKLTHMRLIVNTQVFIVWIVYVPLLIFGASSSSSGGRWIADCYCSLPMGLGAGTQLSIVEPCA